MCELMAMEFRGPISADFSIKAFSGRGEENADGWGLAWYPDQSLAIVKEPVRWGASRYAAFLADHAGLCSRIYLAHVRDKTRGGPNTHADTHPFSRERGGREYAFAHNGTLDDRVWDLPIGPSRPVGATDSEHAFCHLLAELDARGGHLDAEPDWLWLHGRLAGLNKLGKLNILLSDGVRVFCYHDLGGWKGLNYRRVRIRDHESRHFGDADVAVELEADSANEGYVVATRPLSESGWRPFRVGELIVFQGGAIQFTSHPEARTRSGVPA